MVKMVPFTTVDIVSMLPTETAGRALMVSKLVVAFLSMM